MSKPSRNRALNLFVVILMFEASLITALVPALAAGPISGGSRSDPPSITDNLPVTALMNWTRTDTIMVQGDGTPNFIHAYGPLDIIQLPDGSYRIYFASNTQTGAIESVMSAKSNDMLNWTVEPGKRIPNSPPSIYSDPFVMRLSNGKYRLYYHMANGVYGAIQSSISDDGLTFTVEPGDRINSAISGSNDVGYPFVFDFGNGTLRMYFKAYDGSHNWIASALSNDGLNWAGEQGRRIDYGGINDSQRAESPWVINLTKGYRMYYLGGDFITGNLKVLSAYSLDGFTWTKESGSRLLAGGKYDSAGISAGDAVIRMPDGKYGMYYAGYDGSKVRITLARADPAVQDISIVPGNIAFSEDPAKEGDKVTISAKVLNHGSEAANGTTVQFRDGKPFNGLDFNKEPGVRLDLGHQGTADQFSLGMPEIIRLDNGSYRLFYQGQDAYSGNGRILSSISNDGYHWKSEPGYRINNNLPQYFRLVGAPNVVRFDNGSYRIYYNGYNNVDSDIFSAISSNGFDFSVEQGTRIHRGGLYDSAGVSDPSMVRLADGNWRMYYYADNATTSHILSAWSKDGINFIKEGPRLEPGGQYDTNVAHSPKVFRTASGHYRMYYTGETASGGHILSAYSYDGLVWTKDPGFRLAPGSGSDKDATNVGVGDLIKLDNGNYRLYYQGCYLVAGISIWIIMSSNSTYADGKVINETTMDIPANGLGTTSTTWDTTGKIGNHSIYVTVDSKNIIRETDETNNTAFRNITVEAGFRGVLNIKADVDPKYNYVEPGENLTVHAKVIVTSGHTNERNVTFKLLDPSGTPVLNNVSKLNSTNETNTTFPLSLSLIPGIYTVWGNFSQVNNTTAVNISRVPPSINHLSEMTYIEGTKGHWLNWTCSDKNPVYYNLSIFGDITFYKSGIYWNGSNISINVDGLAVGKYQYRLVIADINNLTADDSVYVTVVKDKPPAINITSPKYGSLVSGLLNITGTASDPDGKVTDVQLNLGGSAWFPANGTDNWFLVWDTWTMTPGWNTITARATDNFGVQNTTSIQVKIPVPPKYLPMVTILSPANNSQTIGIVQVKGTTSVKNGTINSVDYKVDNGAWSKATGTSSWSFDWDTRTYTNRTYVIHVRATDNLSATAEALLYLIVANPHPNNPPTITITSPKSMETVGMAIVIKGTASDPDGDNITVKVRIDNDPWQNATGNKDWKFNWNTVVKKNGNYTITARATDEHGASSDVSLTIKVENQGKPHQDTTSTTEDTVKSACYVIIVAATIAGTAAAGSYAFTDLGRWLRFRGLLMQMYSKRRDDKVLDNFIRGWVQGVVVRDPGIRPVDVIETFEGQYSGNLIYYHINELVRFGYVYMVQRNRNGQIVKVWKGDNGKVVENVHITDAEKATDFTVRNSTLLGLSLHLYPSDIMAPKSQLNLRKKQRFMVYKYLVQNPGRNQTEIADALDMVRQAVAYHLKELQKDGLLIVGTSGRAKYYYVDSGIGQKDVGLRAEVGPVQAPSNQLRTE